MVEGGGGVESKENFPQSPVFFISLEDTDEDDDSINNGNNGDCGGKAGEHSGDEWTVYPKRSFIEEKLGQQRRRSYLSSLSSSPTFEHAYQKRLDFLEGRRVRLAEHSELVRGKREKMYAKEEAQKLQVKVRLSNSLANAEEKRLDRLEEFSRTRAERERRQRQSIAQTRRLFEKEQRDYWAKMKEREFVVKYRRERLLLVPRSRLLNATIHRSEELFEAATLIQSTWERGKIRPLLAVFGSTGILDITPEDNDDGYERMKMLMMNPKVIQIATKLVDRLVKCDPVVQLLKKSTSDGRILLTAFLFSRFGSQVIPDADKEEISLLEYAGNLVESFMAFLTLPIRSLMLNSTEAWFIFKEAFTVWQTQSRPILVKQMQQDYANLQEIASQLGTAAARQEWIPYIERHQTRLRKALYRVAGREALEKLEEKLCSINLNQNLNEKLTSLEGSSNFTTESISSEELQSIDRDFNFNQLTEYQNVPPTLTPSLANIQIIHELTIDPKFDYRKLIELKTGQSYESNYIPPMVVVKSKDLKDFFEFVLLVRNQLIDMVRNQGPFAQELQTNLEEAFLREQLFNNSIDCQKILTFLAEVMSKMCAPVRDASLACLIGTIPVDEVSVSCEKLASIMLLMHEDLINYSLNSLKVRLASTVVPYERNWYAANVLLHPVPIAQQWTIQVGTIMKELYSEYKPLARTGAIMVECVLALLGFPHDRLNNVQQQQQQQPPDILNHELLCLDRARLVRLKSTLFKISLLCAISLALKAFSHPNPKEVIMHCRTLVLVGSASDLTTNTDFSLIETEVIRNIDDNQLVASLVSTVQRIINGTDPIVTLLRRRISALLRSSLLEETLLPFKAKPNFVLLRNGIAEALLEDYNSAAHEIVRLFHLHRQVLIPIYHKYLTDLDHQ